MEFEKQLVRITQTKTEIVYLFNIRFHYFACSSNIFNKHCVQNEALKSKPNFLVLSDVVGVVSTALINFYKSNYSKCSPFPWNESVTCNIRDMYTPIDIIDSEG